MRHKPEAQVAYAEADRVNFGRLQELLQGLGAHACKVSFQGKNGKGTAAVVSFVNEDATHFQGVNTTFDRATVAFVEKNGRAWGVEDREATIRDLALATGPGILDRVCPDWHAGEGSFGWITLRPDGQINVEVVRERVVQDVSHEVRAAQDVFPDVPVDDGPSP